MLWHARTLPDARGLPVNPYPRAAPDTGALGIRPHCVRWM